MGSLNASGIPVVPKQRQAFRQIGRAITVSFDPYPQGKQGSDVDLISTPPLSARSAAELGTQPDEQVQQYTTVDQSSAQKVTESLTDELVERHSDTYVPTAQDQPEIANKPVSQHGVVHTGNRLVVRNSDSDLLVAREGNDSPVA